jgi:hypothetical protein
MMLPALEALPPAGRLRPAPPPDEANDPWRRRPVLGEPVWDATTGLEVFRRVVDGLLPRPPISYLTGLQFEEAGPGSATSRCPPRGGSPRPPATWKAA